MSYAGDILSMEPEKPNIGPGDGFGMELLTVTMKSVYTFSEAGLVEPIHIVDLMNVKKELEFFLMKRAMWLAICNHGIHNRTNVMMSCLNLPTC